MKEIDKMISGHLYKVSDGELVKRLSDAKDLCDVFNFTSRNGYDKWGDSYWENLIQK